MEPVLGSNTLFLYLNDFLNSLFPSSYGVILAQLSGYLTSENYTIY